MSKLRCQCGNVIVDQATNLPFLASVLADQDGDSLERFAQECARYFEAVGTNKRREWLENWYGKFDEALAGIDDSSVVYDIFDSVVGRHRRDLYQCQGCGRLHLQIAPQGDRFRSFSPDADWQDALVGTSRSKPK